MTSTVTPVRAISMIARGFALEVGEDTQALAGEPAADLGQDRRINEARREVSPIAPVNVNPIAVAVKEHADLERPRSQCLEPGSNHRLLDGIGIAQRERSVRREMQRFQHGPRAVEGQHHLSSRRAEEVVMKDAGAAQSAGAKARPGQAVGDVVFDQLLRSKRHPAGGPATCAPAR